MTPAPEGTGAAAWSDTALLSEFAGNYSHSTGFGAFHLLIGCDNTFHELIITDFGAIMSFEGSIAVRNRRMVLTGESGDGSAHSLDYIPVRWGARKYLIGSYELASCCDSIKSTDRFKEPRGKGEIGFFYLRYDDGDMEVTGFPPSLAGNEMCR